MNKPLQTLVQERIRKSGRLILMVILMTSVVLAIRFIPHLNQIFPVPVYLTLHLTLEFLGIVICICVFMVAWYNFQQTRNLSEYIICLAFLSIGLVNFAHVLSQVGMPDFFTPNSPNKALNYWLIGRGIEAGGILLAALVDPVRFHKRLKPPTPLLVMVLVTLSALVVIAGGLNITMLNLPWQGQIFVKDALDFSVIFVESITLAFLLTKKKVFTIDLYLVYALLFSVISEIVFRFFSSDFDTYNLAGHVFKVLAYSCILRGLLVSSVSRLEEATKVLEERRKRLAEVNSQVNRVNKLKSDFLANTNHELRTPLTAIIAFTELLLDKETGPLNEMQQDYLKEINESGQKLLNEFNNLLDMSKIEAGKMKLFYEYGSFEELVRYTLKMSASMFDLKKQQVSIKISELLPAIHMDKDKVKKIIINLFSNAHKFTSVGGKITFGADLSEDGHYIEAYVADSGIGLTLEQVDHIFDRFYQVDDSLTRTHHGSGLGLTLTKHFVELHGGNIWIISEPGAGSTFYFSLPVHAVEKEVVL